MKGTIEINWKILIAIIAFVIIFIVAFLLLSGMLTTEKISSFMADICALLISKLGIFGFGAEKMEICRIFETG
jgi:hypothetical protein